MNRRRRRAPILFPLTIAIALGVASLYALEALAGWLAPASVAERATVQPPPGFGGSIQTLWFLGGGALTDSALADAETLPSLTCAELARRYVSLTWRCRNLGHDGDDSLAALQRLVALLRDPDIVRPDNVILVGGAEDGATPMPGVWDMKARAARQFPNLMRLTRVPVSTARPRPANMARAAALATGNLRTLREWASGAEVSAIALLPASPAPGFAAARPPDSKFFHVVEWPTAANPRDPARQIADLIEPVERF